MCNFFNVWENRIIQFLFFSNFILLGVCQGKDKIFIKYPVGINDRLSSPFTKQPISGIVYRLFQDPSLEPKLVGELNLSMKNKLWTRWWDTGKPKYRGEYLNGLKSGLWLEWDQKGQLRFESVYLNGKVIQLKNCLLETCDSTFVIKPVEIKI